MKLFLDSAHVPDIARWAESGLINGITTNPSNLSKETGDFKALIREICNLLPEGDINVEVTKEDPKDVYRQAHAIAAFHKNIIVKIPCHTHYYPVIKKLLSEGIRLNITLVFTLFQGLLMSKLGVTYISPFVARWDDIGVQGSLLLRELRYVSDIYDFKTEILAASLRHARHIHDAMMAGCHVVTVPVSLLESAIEHPLTDIGMKKFSDDWKRVGDDTFF